MTPPVVALVDGRMEPVTEPDRLARLVILVFDSRPEWGEPSPAFTATPSHAIAQEELIQAHRESLGLLDALDTAL